VTTNPRIWNRLQAQPSRHGPSSPPGWTVCRQELWPFRSRCDAHVRTDSRPLLTIRQTLWPRPLAEFPSSAPERRAACMLSPPRGHLVLVCSSSQSCLPFCRLPSAVAGGKRYVIRRSSRSRNRGAQDIHQMKWSTALKTCDAPHACVAVELPQRTYAEDASGRGDLKRTRRTPRAAQTRAIAR
jgi:hypothetical protein